MKKILKVITVGLVIFIIGGLGGLLIDYVLFAKLLTHPVWSQNEIVKTFGGRVEVIKTVEKVVVADNESIADIASRAAGTVAYVETIETSGATKAGSGAVVSSDGVIVTTENIVTEGSESISVKLSDGSVYDVDDVYVDDYTNLVFLRIDAHDLATVALTNSDDMRSGKRLISISRTRFDNNARFALGGFFGYQHLVSTALPKSDFLQGVLALDFSDSVFRENVGAPIVDFHGDMVGIIDAQDSAAEPQEFYAVAANDIQSAFESFLLNQADEGRRGELLLGVDYEMITELDVHLGDVDITSGALIYTPQTYLEQSIFAKTLAARSGIMGGDIIVMVNNDTVDIKNNLSRLMYKNRSSDKVALKVLRDGNLITVEILAPNTK